MGSVVQLNIPFRQATREARIAAAIQRFTEERRRPSDVFWLKENAELLGVLESTGTEVPQTALAPWAEFYEGLDRKLAFFPQYYRFLLSLALDLEDLGLQGDKGERAVQWIVSQDLVAAELSDLQRAEARRLCVRRGVDPLDQDQGLEDRLRAFGSRGATFSLPNKKAAYELTHIVFYLSEYGRKNPCLPEPFLDSLSFAGTLAFLELNVDLLAEVCIALRFAGKQPPAVWENWLTAQTRLFVCIQDAQEWAQDDYHPYLMTNWYALVSKTGGFSLSLPEGPVAFRAPEQSVSPLRELSQCLFELDDARTTDWTGMRQAIESKLSEESFEVVAAAATVTDFEVFFAGFARAERPNFETKMVPHDIDQVRSRQGKRA